MEKSWVLFSKNIPQGSHIASESRKDNTYTESNYYIFFVFLQCTTAKLNITIADISMGPGSTSPR